MLSNQAVVDYIKDEMLMSPEVEYQWVDKICKLGAVDNQMYNYLSQYMASEDAQIRRFLYRKMQLFYEDYFKP